MIFLLFLKLSSENWEPFTYLSIYSMLIWKTSLETNGPSGSVTPPYFPEENPVKIVGYSLAVTKGKSQYLTMVEYGHQPIRMTPFYRLSIYVPQNSYVKA